LGTVYISFPHSFQVKDGSNEPIKHGGCLGLGLAAMGTRRADVYEQLKFTLYQVPVRGLLGCQDVP
jgi:Proteasome/cyclosome repeat